MGKGNAKARKTQSRYAVKFAKRLKISKPLGFVVNAKGKRLPLPLPIIVGLNGAKLG